MTFRATVILACHNVAEYIEDALDSLIAQSRFREMEIIPVDDGSTDATWSIIQRYAQANPDNFFPIHFDKGSGGPGRPRNAGLDQARGEYVIFMDPDDRVFEDGYSFLLSAMEEHASDILIGTRYYVPPRAGIDQMMRVDFDVEHEYVNENTEAIKRDLLGRGPVILKTIYRLDLINKWEMRFLESVSSSEDEIFDKKYILSADKITKLNKLVYLYTASRPGSITSKISIKTYSDLHEIVPGIDDALGVYFHDNTAAERIAGLLKTFYLRKILLLDPRLMDEALEHIYVSCKAFGFDRLLRVSDPVDRRICELLSEHHFAALMTYFMNWRMGVIRSGDQKRLKAAEAALAAIKAEQPTGGGIMSRLVRSARSGALARDIRWALSKRLRGLKGTTSPGK